MLQCNEKAGRGREGEARHRPVLFAGPKFFHRKSFVIFFEHYPAAFERLA